MNLSKLQLKFLTKTLPKMRFSTVIRWAMEDGADPVGYLSIRKAGQRIVLAAKENDDEEAISIIDQEYGEIDREEKKILKEIKKSIREKKERGEELNDEEKSVDEEANEKKELRKFQEGSDHIIPDVLNMIKERINSKYEPDARARLDKSIQSNPNKDRIMQDLSSNKFIKDGSYASIKNDIKSFAKDMDMKQESMDLASVWVSLLRMKAGYDDKAISDKITYLADRKLSSDLIKSGLGITTKEDGYNEMAKVLMMGRKLSNQGNLLEEIEKAFSKEGQYIGADTIKFKINQLLTSFASSAFDEFKREQKRSPRKVPIDKEIETDGGSSSLHETIGDPSAGSSELSNKEKHEVIGALIAAKDEALLAFKSKAKDDQQYQNVVFAIEDAADSGSYPAGSDKQFTKLKNEWEKRGILTKEQWRTDVKNPIQVGIANDIDRIMQQKVGPDYAAIIRRSSSLSHQLLLRAVSSDKIILASKVSSINFDQNEGNAKVFEIGRPQFAHELYWKIEDNKVRIAEVNDIDEDHINDAYQAAFEAIQQEVLINNLESFSENISPRN